MCEAIDDYDIEEDERPIEETENRGGGVPLTLIVPKGEEHPKADDTHRLIARLKTMSYGVHKEYENEYQAVYTVQPLPE